MNLTLYRRQTLLGSAGGRPVGGGWVPEGALHWEQELAWGRGTREGGLGTSGWSWKGSGEK